MSTTRAAKSGINVVETLAAPHALPRLSDIEEGEANYPRLLIENWVSL